MNIKQVLQNEGYEFKHYKSVNSTMDKIKELFYYNKNKLFIIADTQVEGKGRRGSFWHSPTGNIYLSFSLEMFIDIKDHFIISAAVALTIAKTIDSICNVNSNIKWPNDILVNGKKISGLITEIIKQNDTNYIIIGVGINVNCNNYDFYIDNFQYRLEPTSVFIESGDIVSREDLIASFLEFFYFWISAFKSKNYKRIVDFWKSNWDDIGADVSFLHEGEEISGKIIDINQKGELILEVSNQLKIISSGEITV